MKSYIGSKIIKAESSNLEIFKRMKYGDAALCKSGDKDILGYIIKYPPIGDEEEPYISWSPQKVFEKAYREIDQSEIELLYGKWD